MCQRLARQIRRSNAIPVHSSAYHTSCDREPPLQERFEIVTPYTFPTMESGSCTRAVTIFQAPSTLRSV